MFYPFSVHFFSIFEHLLTTGVQPGSSFPLAHVAMPRRPGTPASADLEGANPKKKSVMGIPEQNGGFNWFYDVQWESQLHMMGFHGFSGHIWLPEGKWSKIFIWCQESGAQLPEARDLENRRNGHPMFHYRIGMNPWCLWMFMDVYRDSLSMFGPGI